MSEMLVFGSFSQHLNTLFRLFISDGQWVDVTLIDAQELRAPRGYEAFSLVFRGSLDGFLPQASYRFNHAAIGAFEMFIVPIRHDAQGYYYEAVFNRLRAEEHL